MSRKLSRRALLTTAPALAAAVPLPAETVAAPPVTETVPLDGPWSFRLDGREQWTTVTVPHTWQIEPETAEYYGVAWYQRQIDVPASWSGSFVRIEFEAVFHSATVYVNGAQAGVHLGKGYTAFEFPITRLLKLGVVNTIAVRVDNGFKESMLPRGRSSDWAHDGGIYRPARLLITPKTYISELYVDATPNLADNSADLDIWTRLENSGNAPAAAVRVTYTIRDEATGAVVLRHVARAQKTISPGETWHMEAKLKLPRARFWHFDHPHLYTLEARLGSPRHSCMTTFGVRSFTIKDGVFHLNGEPLKPMGVERMAGSNPEYGMAEPTSWIEHDHADMKNLNCVFTRVHWPQDRRVLDYCDRHGILIQIEVPAWGPNTFKGMTDEPSPEIMNSGLEQLREMIARDRNHPSIFAWGLCNEINGQNPPAYKFAARMLQEAKRLDPNRLCTYASHSLFTTPERDVSRLMDFVSWNEYYGSWQKGGPDDVRRTLDAIVKAFPGKPVVVSEYGYCACTADRPEDDGRRAEILRTQDAVFRDNPAIAGLIFFCYNDYRTHVGDKGVGALKQRVHGVVDLYGNRKPSYEDLRRESSPIESLRAEPVAGGGFKVEIRARKNPPAYLLRDYRVRAVLCGAGGIPLEQREIRVSAMHPGETISEVVQFVSTSPKWVRFDVIRPTEFSAATYTLKLA